MGPSRFTEMIEWVDGGTVVAVLGENTGWYRVKLPDGREGYIWGEHIEQIGPIEPGLPATAGAPGDPMETPRADLRADMPLDPAGALEHPDAARAEIDRLSAQIERLTKAQEDLKQSLDDSVFTGLRTPIDGSAIAGGAFLTIGGIIGWMLARLTQRRRDRRSRLRL